MDEQEQRSLHANQAFATNFVDQIGGLTSKLVELDKNVGSLSLAHPAIMDELKKAGQAKKNLEVKLETQTGDIQTLKRRLTALEALAKTNHTEVVHQIGTQLDTDVNNLQRQGQNTLNDLTQKYQDDKNQLDLQLVAHKETTKIDNKALATNVFANHIAIQQLNEPPTNIIDYEGPFITQVVNEQPSYAPALIFQSLQNAKTYADNMYKIIGPHEVFALLNRLESMMRIVITKKPTRNTAINKLAVLLFRCAVYTHDGTHKWGLQSAPFAEETIKSMIDNQMNAIFDKNSIKFETVSSTSYVGVNSSLYK
jgi:hypothetical protein